MKQSFPDFHIARFICALKVVFVINVLMQFVLLTPIRWAVCLFIVSIIFVLVSLNFLEQTQADNTYDRAQEWVRLTMSPTLKLPFISHRGENPDAPANTMAAFKLALKRGARGLEVDLHLSKDNHIVLIHDSCVDTTTNDSGPVSSFTADELRNLKMNFIVSNTGEVQISEKDCHIPLLNELVEYLIEHDDEQGYARDQGTRLVLDVKDSSTEMITQLIRLFRRFPDLYNTAIVAGFNPILMYKIRKEDPAILIGLTIRPDFVTKQVRPSQTTGVTARLCSILDAVFLWVNETISWVLISNSFCLIQESLMCSSTVSKWRKRRVEPIFWTIDGDVKQRFCAEKNALSCPFISNHTLKG